MTLAGAGPLLPLIDADEPDHERCREALDGCALPLVTTWPAFTEAMYLLGRVAGWKGQNALWRLVLRDDLVAAPSPALDADCHVYRLKGRRRFEVVRRGC